MSSPRYFVAFEPSIPVAERLMALQLELEQALGPEDPVHWVHPENLRLTLKHLGELSDEALLEPLQAQLSQLAAPLFPFQVECKRVAWDPSPGRARRIWAMVDEQSADVLDLLRRALEKELEEVGFDHDARPFHAGMLLGRPQRTGSARLLERLEGVAETRFGTSTIKDLVLFATRADRPDERYEVIHRFPLGSI